MTDPVSGRRRWMANVSRRLRAFFQGKRTNHGTRRKRATRIDPEEEEVEMEWEEETTVDDLRNDIEELRDDVGQIAQGIGAANSGIGCLLLLVLGLLIYLIMLHKC